MGCVFLLYFTGTPSLSFCLGLLTFICVCLFLLLQLRFFFFDLFFVLFCFNFYTWNLKHLFDKWIKSFTLLGNDPFTKDNENKVP